MAKFLDTTIQGNMTVNGDIMIGESEKSVLSIIDQNFNNLHQLFMKDRVLDYTVATDTAGWTINASGVYLIGNILRLHGKATRSTAPDGNIGNENPMIFTINHGGRIKGIYNMCFANSGTGSFSSWYTQNTTNGDTSTVTIRFSGTRSGNTGKQFGFYVHLPVELNTEYYDALEEKE